MISICFSAPCRDVASYVSTGNLSALLEAELQSQLHTPLELGVGEFSKGWVHLGEMTQVIKLELRIGVYRGPVGVIEDIIGFGAELEFETFAGHGDLLEERHIPVIDPWSAEVVPGTKTRSALRSTLEGVFYGWGEDKSI